MHIQILVVLLYFVLTVTIGILSSRKQSKDSTSFYGAGMGVFLIVAASSGEWLGGTSTTGVSEYGFNFGLSGAWYTIANGVGIVFLSLFFAKLYRSMNEITVPGIIGRFLGVKARTVSSVFLVFVMLAVGISQMIAAGSLGVSLLGINFNLAVVIFGIVFIVYTLSGGMKAVASTNIMHLIVMYGGLLLGLFLSVHMIGGWDSL